MVSIAWRLSLSRRRKVSWKLRHLISSDGDLDALRAASASPEARLQSAEYIASVQRQIRRLPPKLRDALLLAAAGDLTQEELAAMLNIPAATFRGRVRDARLRLRTALKQIQ
jgi:RNA polymerase sigma-70 factor (ECF subfamily)